MTNKTIIISANTSWNIYNFRINLVKYLLNEGFKLKILVPENDKYSKALESIGCKIFLLNLEPRKKSIFEFLNLLTKYIYFFYKIKPSYYLSFTIKPNLIGTLSSIFFKVKVINNITGLGSVFIQKNIITKIIIIFLYKIIFLKSKTVFFQNKSDLFYFVNNKIINKNKAALIPGSGINYKFYEYREPKTKQNKNYNFLYFGRVISEKGILELFSAIKIVKKKFKNLSFTIIGNTDVNDKKYNLITENIRNSKNLFIYKKYTENIIQHIRYADCVILPSYREGLPRSLLESASCGVPIMASNVPGCNDIIINNETGILFNVKDDLDIADKINYFININHEKKIKITKNARNKIEKEFDENLIIKNYSKYIY